MDAASKTNGPGELSGKGNNRVSRIESSARLGFQNVAIAKRHKL